MDKQRQELVQELAAKLDEALCAIYGEPVSFVLVSGPEPIDRADVIGNVPGEEIGGWLRVIADKVDAAESKPTPTPPGIKVPETSCPHCGTRLNGAFCPDTDHMPEEGDVTICIECEEMCQFDVDLNLVALDPEVLSKIDLVQLQRLKKTMHRAKSDA